jgi:transcriptional regulator with XRE-family HTH domain
MGRLGLTQEDLAYKLRKNGFTVSRRSLVSWLNGEASPRYDGIREIVMVLAAVSAGDSPKASSLSPAVSGKPFGPERRLQHALHSEPRIPSRQVPRRRKTDVAA